MLLKNGLRDKHQAMSKDPLEFRQRSHPLENMSMCLIFDDFSSSSVVWRIFY